MTQKSDRHWYPRYPGDYARKTAHLSLTEDGAYAKLMDWYYSNSRPLPNDWVQMHRICKAIAPFEQEAVQSVVEQFFTLSDAGWSNGRADEEIQKKGEISDKRRVAQAIREKIRTANAGAKRGANAPSNAHTTTSTTTLDNTNVLSPPISPRERSGYSPEFETFWQTYPNRTGKAAAYKAYQGAIKQHGVNHEQLLDGAGKFADAHKAAGTPAQYIPHPTTWLNQGRWEDDLSGIKQRQDATRPAAAANARGSQFNALMAATSELLQEQGGHMGNGQPGLSERMLAAPVGLQPTGWPAPESLPGSADQSNPAGTRTIDHDDAGSTDG